MPPVRSRRSRFRHLRRARDSTCGWSRTVLGLSRGVDRSGVQSDSLAQRNTDRSCASRRDTHGVRHRSGSPAQDAALFPGTRRIDDCAYDGDRRELYLPRRAAIAHAAAVLHDTMTPRTLSCTTLAGAVLSAALIAQTPAEINGSGRSVAGRVTAAAEEETVALHAGQRVERQLRRGEEHRYRIVLAPDEHARIVVAQQGIDVLVQVRRSEDGHLVELDDEVCPRAAQQVDILEQRDGPWLVMVKAARRAAVSGSYANRGDRPPARHGRGSFNAGGAPPASGCRSIGHRWTLPRRGRSPRAGTHARRSGAGPRHGGCLDGIAARRRLPEAAGRREIGGTVHPCGRDRRANARRRAPGDRQDASGVSAALSARRGARQSGRAAPSRARHDRAHAAARTIHGS